MNNQSESPDSYYLHSANNITTRRQLTESVDADVCVIGGGYTGLLTALNLAEKNYKVVLLEARKVGWGASGRNGGQVGSGHNKKINDLENDYGKDLATRLWDLAEDAKPLSPVQQDQMRLGADYYLNRCAICHGADGKGITSLAPTLVESVWVTGPSEILARIVLQGLQGPIEVQGETWNAMMPGHASVPDFDDETAAGLLTYLHRAWGHAGRAIDPKFIARTRVEISDHRGLWTVKEFEDLEINTHYRKYVGRYGGGAFSLNFEFDGRDLIVQSIYFNGPMVEQKEDHFFFEPREFSVEFVWDENNEISAVRVPLQGGVELPRVRD